MYKFFVLVFKNMSRNRLRTVLTGLAVLILSLVYAVASSTTAAVGRMVAENSSINRLVITDRWTTPSQLPARIVDKICEKPGIEDWTTWRYYFGFLDESKRSDRFAFGIATRIENIRQMHPGLEAIDPAALEALRTEKAGALVGPAIIDTMKWRIGQRFTLLSATHSGKNLEFKIVGALPPGKWANSFFFREDYYRQGLRDEETMSVMWLQARDAPTGQRLAAEIERMYANSPTPVKVETEASSVARFAGKATSIMGIVRAVVFVLLIDMLVIISNSISITTRERRVEMAVLKVLGFQPNYIIRLVIVEAVLIAAVAGGLGAGLICLVSAWNMSESLPFTIGFLRQFPVTPDFFFKGMALGALAGLLGSILPAWSARTVRVTDVFARIA